MISRPSMSKPPLAAAALNLLGCADEDRGKEAALLQAVGSLENAGIRPFGKDNLARICLENFNQTVKHESFLQYDRASARISLLIIQPDWRENQAKRPVPTGFPAIFSKTGGRSGWKRRKAAVPARRTPPRRTAGRRGSGSQATRSARAAGASGRLAAAARAGRCRAPSAGSGRPSGQADRLRARSAQALRRQARDGRVDDALRRLRHTAHGGMIGLVLLRCNEQSVGVGVLCQQHHAERIAVEPADRWTAQACPVLS